MPATKTQPAPATFANLLALHRADAAAFTAEGRPEAAFAAYTIADAVDVAEAGDATLTCAYLDDFYAAYDDGELDAARDARILGLEATYHALAERFLPGALDSWMRLPAPRALAF